MKSLRQRLERRLRGGRSDKNLVGNSGPRSGDPEVDEVLDDIARAGTKQGNVMDFYRIEEELGRGAFARVYRGIERQRGKEVAVKIVSLRSIADKAVLEHRERIKRMKKLGKDWRSEEKKTRAEVEREAKKRVLAIMQSEIAVMRKISKIPSRKTRNIVQLRDVLLNERQICVCMDLLTGGELFDRIISRKRYSEKDAAFHVRRIMRALRTLHANGIIHRDLKPENLVFESPEENSQIKLADFGLACIQGQPDIHANSVVGSPGYIAPEVLERKEYSPACDVWSMGVILYILFVGGPPFHGRNDRETFRKIKAGSYTYPSNVRVSALARDLVSKCLIVDPRLRITVSGFLNHPWLLQKAATADAYIGLERLQKFNIQTKLKAVTTGLVWGSRSGLRRELYALLEGTSREAGLTGEELTLIRTALFKFRKNGRTLTKSQFVYALRELGHSDLPLEGIYALFDTNDDDKADIIEIIVGLSTAAKEWDGSSQVRFCFETYDRDGDGKVSLADLTKVVKVVASEVESNIAQRFGSLFQTWTPQHDQVSIDEVEQRLREVPSPAPHAGLETDASGLSVGRAENDAENDAEIAPLTKRSSTHASASLQDGLSRAIRAISGKFATPESDLAPAPEHP